MSGRLRSLLGLVLATAACGRPPPPVDLSGAWPAQVATYPRANADWTRHAILRGDFEQSLELFATLQAPPWLAARAAHAARARGASVEAATAAAQEAAAGDLLVTLVVTTHDRAENDLDRGERSVWRLALVDDRGVETAPLSITRDRRPRPVIAAEVDHLGDFAEVYLARFPHDAIALGPSLNAVTLRMWSPRGAVAVSWRAR